MHYEGDYDNDGAFDENDNCTYVNNPGQEDSDVDGIGDVCDNCPFDYNLEQQDNDFDGLGDVCDDDDDNDNALDGIDNCPMTPNDFDLGTCTDGLYGRSCMIDSNCGVSGICSINQEDSDGDGIGDACDNCSNDQSQDQTDQDQDGVGDICDNCPDCYIVSQNEYCYPNGPLLGICTLPMDLERIVSTGQYCMVDFDCDNGEFCEKTQEDTYPPGGNGIGDACDCEGDFNCDGSVYADDLDLFLIDFGRSQFFNPCTNEFPCNGDFNCDGNVDSKDFAVFEADFGRTQWYNPCPACTSGDWCVY